MPLAILLLAAAPDAAATDAAAMVATARTHVAGPRCTYDAASTDVTVCGLRHADRYRVPLKVERPRGSAIADAASTERALLIHRATPLEQLSPFLVEGGHAGVSATVGFGPGAGSGKARLAGARPLAP